MEGRAIRRPASACLTSDPNRRLLRRVLHRAGKQAVHRDPGVIHVGREAIAKTLFQRPEECRTDSVVMGVCDSVTCMASSKVLDNRHELIEAIEAFHCGG